MSAPFAAVTESGTLRGTVLFVEYAGAVYGIVAYAPEAPALNFKAAQKHAYAPPALTHGNADVAWKEGNAVILVAFRDHLHLPEGHDGHGEHEHGHSHAH